ncbi:MAG: hypothetical protein H0S84_12790 [Bacteroidales bacterium]|nr:hypothetical protein [Bacteroidales bacterium]
MKSKHNPFLILVMLATLIMAATSCNKSIKTDTNTVLVAYNDAIADYHNAINSANLFFDQRTIQLFNLNQTAWDNVAKEHKIDSLMNWFYEKHGPEAYNELLLIVDDNFNEKVNKLNR